MADVECAVVVQNKLGYDVVILCDEVQCVIRNVTTMWCDVECGVICNVGMLCDDVECVRDTFHYHIPHLITQHCGGVECVMGNLVECVVYQLWW